MEAVELTKPVPPNPSLPKTIGTLNILFGCLLMLCGLGCLSTTLPALTKAHGIRLDPEETQRVVDQMRIQMLTELRKAEDEAKDGAEKERFRTRIRELEAKPMKVKDQIDFAQVNAGFAWLSRYLWVDVFTGPILNILMVIAGIGLVRLTAWGRSLGIAVALLKTLRLIALAVLLTVYVIPSMTKGMSNLIKTEIGEAVFTKAMDDQRAKQGGQAPPGIQDPKELVPLITTFWNGYAILFTSFGAIYPVITLVVLTRPGARAACASPKDVEGDFGLEHRDEWSAG